MGKSILVIVLMLNMSLAIKCQETNLYRGGGSVAFLSEAPLEVFKASSDRLNGVLNLDDHTFGFSFQVNTFKGFNSPLQRIHFNEHYLETEKYPKATFVGKLIGTADCNLNCEIIVYAKGDLTIHGITKFVTIPVNFKKGNNIITANTEFHLTLDDFEIAIPLILRSKIASVIKVSVDVSFIK